MKPLYAIVLSVLLIAGSAGAETRLVKSFTVDPAGVTRIDSPLSATLQMELPDGQYIMLPNGPYGGPATPVQIERSGPNVTLYWIERKLQANSPRTYGLFKTDEKPGQMFRFTQGDGTRDLLFGDQPIWRDMLKYDPADRANTFKPYKHVFAFDSKDDFITKGPGGLYTHHRGIFFGFKAWNGDKLRGDFWHCPDVTQRHVKYLDDRELLGEVIARDASVTDWVAKDEKPVVRDTREVTTWHIAPNDIVMDFTIKVEALTDEPIKLGGDAHHAGFHFRAAQEVADAKGPDGKPMAGATYIRPDGAKLTKNDIWENENWANMTFSVKGHSYMVTHFDAPTNVRPIQYSTRPYGRVGSFFVTEVSKEKPLTLRYRLRVRDGQSISPKTLEQEYSDYRTPVIATPEK